MNNQQPVPYEDLSQSRSVETAASNVEETRAVKEIEARVILAKRFPRNEELARSKVLSAFENAKLAEAGMYSYPRGNTTVADLSIRAAETIGNYWGNLEYGITEVNRGPNYSEMLAYCWDLETNVYHHRKFTVKHWRDKRGGGAAVTGERDIYEVTFNAGARRLRACILECIPAHIKDETESAIQATLKRAAEGVPIEERLKKMVTAFEPLGVSEDMISTRLGHKLSVISEQELIQLRGIFRAILEGQGKIEEYFEADKHPKEPKPAEKPAKDAKKKSAKTSKKKGSKKTSKKAAAKPEDDKPGEEETTGDANEPGMSYSDIFKALTMAKDEDKLDELLDVTSALTNEKQRESLKVAIEQKRATFSDPEDGGQGGGLGLD